MPFDLDEARSRVAGLEPANASALRATISELARPRLTGSEGAAEVERELRTRFEALGFETREFPFSFSTWPGRFGLAAAGAVLALTGVLGAWLIAVGQPTLALLPLIVGMALAVASILVLDRAIRTAPWDRVDATNLLFQRPDRMPSWIVMAHRDSKSQLVPTFLRTTAIGAAGVAWLALFALAVLGLSAPSLLFPTAAVAVGLVLAAAGIVLGLSWSENASPGALDNASGLAALLAVAKRVGADGDVAFLFTEGEELGLAGARDVAARLPPVQGVINVDGLDDRGRLVLAEGAGWRRRGSAPQLVAALLTAASALDFDIERRPLPLTLMVDHLPILAQGIPSLTLMRGGWRSLLRVHTPGDRADRLQGRGAAEAATLLLAAIQLLQDDRASHLAGRRAIRS